jgi:hypothetical protein
MTDASCRFTKGSASNGGGKPLVVDPTPEPASFRLMAAGILVGGILCLMRRRTADIRGV